jgi:hypothetical protein
MPTPLDLSTLIAQMPHVSKVQSAAASHPDAQQAVLAQHVAELHKRHNRMIEKVQKKESSSQVHKDANPNEKRSLDLSDGRKRDDGEGDQEQAPSASSPWAGNIINLEI